MNQRQKILVNTAVITALVIAILGVSYAYFSANISGNETSTTMTIDSGNLTIAFAGGNSITVENAYPQSDSVASKMFTVTGTNTTDQTLTYNLTLIIDSNTFSSSTIKYTLTSVNTGGSGTVVPSISTQTGIATGASTITLGSGTFTTGSDKLHTYVLDLFFPDTGTDQNAEQGKIINAHIGITSDSI